MSIKPLNGNVVVRREATKEQTEAGLYLPESTRDKNQQATVIAVAANSELAVGDVVLLANWTGIEVEGSEVLIVEEKTILGIIESN